MAKKLLLGLFLILGLVNTCWAAARTSAGTGNWSATGTWTGGVVPVEGDTVTIQNTHTVTIDQDITVGADTTTAAINIASGGKLQLLYTAAADYTLTLKGDMTVSGTLEIGTVANPIPSTRKFYLKTNYSASLADGEFGLKIQTGGTCTIQGASMTDRALLAANAAAAATSLTTDVSTGWKLNDVIGIASTSRTYTECETRTLSADASTYTLTVPAITYAHSGTSPTQAELINLTRNILITSYNTTYEGYIVFETTSIVDIDWAEFSYLGYNATDKYGLVIKTTTGSFNLNRCSLHDFLGTNVSCVRTTGGSVNNVTISNNVLWWGGSYRGIYIPVTSGNNVTLDNNILMYGTGSYGFFFDDAGFTCTNNTTVGIYNYSFYMNEAADLGTFTGNTAHSNGGIGIYIGGAVRNGTLSNLTVWRNNNTGLYICGYNLTVSNSTAFGNASYNIRVDGSHSVTLDTVTANGDTSFATTYGVTSGYTTVRKVKLTGCNFSSVSGIKTAHTNSDVYVYASTSNQIDVVSSTMAASTPFNVTADAVKDSFIKVYSTGDMRAKAYMVNGIVSDQVIGGQAAGWARGGSGYCLYMDPTSTTATLDWEFYLPVTAGTDPQFKLYVKKTSAAANCTLNIDVYDVESATKLVDNASITLTDTWAQYSLTSISPANTGYCRVVLKAQNGSTTGDIGIDDFSFVKDQNTYTDGLDYWQDKSPFLWFKGSPAYSFGSAN